MPSHHLSFVKKSMASCSPPAMTEPESGNPLEPFLRIPWCSQILQDPAWAFVSVPQPRYPGHDALWFDLLNGLPRGVGPRCLLERSNATATETGRETRQLIVLGSAVTSSQGICHGGFVSVIMDEVGITTIRHYNLDGGRDPATAFLNVTYKKPVRAPGVIMATAKIVEVVRKKIRVWTTIVDDQGDICATAEMLVVALTITPTSRL